jgi:hypothetical protein
LEAAASVGYGIADAIDYGDVPVSGSVNEARLAALSEAARGAYLAALVGPPDEQVTDPNDVVSVMIPNGPTYRWNRHSCYSQARAALYPDPVRYVQLDNARVELTNEAHARVNNSPEYATALSNWRRCMKEHTMDSEFPGTAAEALKDAYRSGQLSLQELRHRETETAVVDATCYRSAGLPEVVERLEQTAQAEVAAGARETVDAFEALLASAVGRARSQLER